MNELAPRLPARMTCSKTPAMHHTGYGIATRLVTWALSDAQGRKLHIVPRCPFVVSCLETRHQFDDALEGRSPAS